MNVFKIIFFSLIANLFTVFSAYSFNADFMTHTPVFYFTKQDWDMAGAATIKALAQMQDGQKVAWKNSNSGAFGYVIPLSTEGSCRNIKIFNSAHGMTSVTRYKFCKIKGEWKAVS